MWDEREMQKALEADGGKLRQLTGEDGPWPRSLPHVVDWQFQRVNDEGDGYLIEVLVRYDIEPYDPGRISGPPEDCYPPEGGCVTDMVVFKAGTDEVVELSETESKEVSDWIEQHHDHNTDRYGDPDAAYEAWRDDQMDRRDDWSGEDW